MVDPGKEDGVFTLTLRKTLLIGFFVCALSWVLALKYLFVDTLEQYRIHALSHLTLGLGIVIILWDVWRTLYPKAPTKEEEKGNDPCEKDSTK